MATLETRNVQTLMVAVLAFVLPLTGAALAEDVNRTGQSQQTSGSGTPHPGNPAEGDKPILPGDQPAKRGTDPSSQVHNIDPSKLTGKKKD